MAESTRANTPAHPLVSSSAERSMQTDLAVEFIAEDRDMLYALAVALQTRLQPADIANASDDENMIAWRLTQMLVARLESTKFMADVRSLLSPLGIGEDMATHVVGRARA